MPFEGPQTTEKERQVINYINDFMFDDEIFEKWNDDTFITYKGVLITFHNWNIEFKIGKKSYYVKDINIELLNIIFK